MPEKKELPVAVVTLLQADELARDAQDALRKARETADKTMKNRIRLSQILTKEEEKAYFEHIYQLGKM